MAKYKRKASVVEAVLWDGIADTANRFFGERHGVDWEYSTPDGEDVIARWKVGERGLNSVMIHLGTWAVRYEDGSITAVSPSVFEMNYEQCEES